MKRLFIFCLLFFGIILNAQEFKGGLVIGATGSQIDGDNYAGYSKGGLMLGVFTSRSLTEKVSIMMEVKYEGKGAAAKVVFDSNAIDPPDQYKIGLHYIEIPLSLHFNLNEEFSFHLGAQAGYCFLQLYRDDYGEVNSINNFNRVEIAGLAGMNYAINERLTASVRFSYSITPIFTVDGGNATRYWYASSYNNTLSVCAFYRLGR